MQKFVELLNTIVWNSPAALPVMIALLVGTGMFMTIRLGFIQIRYIGHAINAVRGKYDTESDSGEISHFQALATALSGTIGIGNIAGVATAIHYGGPGALFWMWVTGVFGTSLKFAECMLAVRYRKQNEDGSYSGGPMYYIREGLGWKPLAVLFAAAASISAMGQGNSIQAFTVAHQLQTDFGIEPWITGLVLAVIVGSVIIGGIKRIASVTQILTPLMTVIYLAAGIIILVVNLDRLPAAFSTIFSTAFSPPGVTGGFAGSFFMHTLIWGVKRGLFSNEAGQGSAAIAYSAAKTTEPVREGTVAMLGPYIDTLIVCSITGLCITVTGAWSATVHGEALNGSPLTAYAFETGLPFLHGYGRYIITAAVLLFATSTIISWSYYGDRSFQFLLGDRAVMPYRYVYIAVLFTGTVAKLETVWGFGDFAIALMTVPNLIAILALSTTVRTEMKEYFYRHSGKHPG
ncbi:MAG TPA: sodium:alanine symporter family protein [Spirochaetota bacterium]|nr:sodium:alanine symporter family protein [Spirochaetota bacterium]